jgi:hypothetical protein
MKMTSMRSAPLIHAEKVFEGSVFCGAGKFSNAIPMERYRIYAWVM